MSFLNKLLKNPLETAALGAGLYFTGGAIAPYLGSLGGAAAGEAAASGITNATLADAAVGTTGYGASAAGSNLGLGGMLKSAAGYAQPAMQAMQAAQVANGLLSGQQTPPPTSQTQQINPQGSQVLAQIAQQGQPQEEQKRRQTIWS